MKGKVVRILKDKRFGFISAEGQDYFFHADSMTNMHFNDVYIGLEVEFEGTSSAKGLRAENIIA